jgi:hypothetical protein
MAYTIPKNRGELLYADNLVLWGWLQEKMDGENFR